LGIFGIWLIGNVVATAVAAGSYTWKGDTYELFDQIDFDLGSITEYSNKAEFCHSYMLLPGIPLLNNLTLSIGYLFCLIYLFLGIAIVSDIFMGAIEVITSKTKTVEYLDNEGNKQSVQVTVWNPTIANLTLMALGSSAPEILLSVIETL
jgi:solute carrier family 8 (sodium/calcium exchanger)